MLKHKLSKYLLDVDDEMTKSRKRFSYSDDRELKKQTDVSFNFKYQPKPSY
jgi:hypothetical protein